MPSGNQTHTHIIGHICYSGKKPGLSKRSFGLILTHARSDVTLGRSFPTMETISNVKALDEDVFKALPGLKFYVPKKKEGREEGEKNMK